MMRLHIHGMRRLGALLAVAALLSAACTENGGAIFATIEQEEQTISSDLPKTVTVQNVLEVNVEGGTAFIAVALNAELGAKGDTWTEADGWTLDWSGITSSIETTAGSGEYATVAGCTFRGAVLLDGLLYAVISVPDAEGTPVTSLFSSSPPSTLATDPTHTLEWSHVVPTNAAATGFADETPEGLLLVNDELFVSTRVSSALPLYALYHYDPAVSTVTSLLSSSSSPATDGACDGAGTYWFVAGVSLYTGDLVALAPCTDAKVATTVAYGGIFEDAAGVLHLSTRDGRILYRSGTTWTSSASLTYPGDSSELAFCDFMDIGSTVYVGSEGRGFFSLTDGLLAEDTMPGSRMPYRTITGLFAATIRGFARLSEVVFVCTAGGGLWHQKLASPSDTDIDAKSWVWD